MMFETILRVGTRVLGVRLNARKVTAAKVVGTRDHAVLPGAPLDVLAGKVLYDHIRNKQQLMGPPPTALGHVDRHQAELLIRAAVASATADGHLGKDEERTLRTALATLEAQVGEPGFITLVIARPTPLESLLKDVRDAHMSSLFYAASLLAIDKHNATNRSYLRFLATRLRLPREVVARLHSQYGMAIDTVEV